MSTTLKYSSADLALMPDNGKRYEIIEGELYVSRQPSTEHQYTCGQLFRFLEEWNERTRLGVATPAPGLILGEDDDVVPDVIWISRERYLMAVDTVGHLHSAPELAIEVLSPGKANEERDRQAKLKLYSRHGVQEYWIVSWVSQFVELYRREQAQLHLTATLYAQDVLESPLLPDFSCQVAKLFLPSLSA